MASSSQHGGADLREALAALEAASDFAVDQLCTDPVWDLVYCHLGMAILTIQACTDERPQQPGDPGNELDSGVASAPGVDTCAAWVQDAAQALRRVGLGDRPRLAVAVTAVADAQAALREVPRESAHGR